MPRNVPDLPPREQRRCTSQGMMWGVGLAIVSFAAVLVWAFVTAPNGQLGSAARQSFDGGACQSECGRKRLQSVGFSLAIGAAVPQQVQLQKLPPEVSSVIGGYQSDDYVLVGDQLVIVDSGARRVVAIVPNIG